MHNQITCNLIYSRRQLRLNTVFCWRHQHCKSNTHSRALNLEGHCGPVKSLCSTPGCSWMSYWIHSFLWSWWGTSNWGIFISPLTAQEVAVQVRRGPLGKDFIGVPFSTQERSLGLLYRDSGASFLQTMLLFSVLSGK